MSPLNWPPPPALALKRAPGLSSKKAVLTTWMTLQSIPEETIITPVILAFLEQVGSNFSVGFDLVD